jgi:hypothetical protein
VTKWARPKRNGRKKRKWKPTRNSRRKRNLT